MIFNMNGGGGKNPLNFRVVGNPQPTNPKTNTIWVDTDTSVTGWVFDVTKPSSAFEGLVWFSTGTSSTAEFNMLKENDIRVYPLSAQQYVNGAWVAKTTKIYKDNAWVTRSIDGSWVDLVTYLYNAGYEYTDATGDWVSFQCKSDVDFYSDGCVKQLDRLVLKTSTSNVCVGFGTSKIIDLTPYSYIEFTVPEITECCRFGASKYRNGSTYDGMAAMVNITLANPPIDGIVRVDVSDLIGSYYIVFCDWHTSFADEVQVTKVVLV